MTCAACGAADVIPGAFCTACGAEAPAADAPDEGEVQLGADPVDEGASPGDLPPAQEARRFQGLMVPLVAAAVVLGIGVPLTALAVSQVGQLPATAPEARTSGPPAPAPVVVGAPVGLGRARLAGSVTLDGAVTPLGCNDGRPPRLVLVGGGTDQYSIILTVPAEAGTYQLEPSSGRFVAVTRILGGAQSWTSRERPGATGVVTVGGDRSVSARFSGLEPNGGGAEGSVDGNVEVRCA